MLLLRQIPLMSDALRLWVIARVRAEIFAALSLKYYAAARCNKIEYPTRLILAITSSYSSHRFVGWSTNYVSTRQGARKKNSSSATSNFIKCNMSYCNKIELAAFTQHTDNTLWNKNHSFNSITKVVTIIYQFSIAHTVIYYHDRYKYSNISN